MSYQGKWQVENFNSITLTPEVQPVVHHEVMEPQGLLELEVTSPAVCVNS